MLSLESDKTTRKGSQAPCVGEQDPASAVPGDRPQEPCRAEDIEDRLVPLCADGARKQERRKRSAQSEGWRRSAKWPGEEAGGGVRSSVARLVGRSREGDPSLFTRGLKDV